MLILFQYRNRVVSMCNSLYSLMLRHTLSFQRQTILTGPTKRTDWRKAPDWCRINTFPYTFYVIRSYPGNFFFNLVLQNMYRSRPYHVIQAQYVFWKNFCMVSIFYRLRVIRPTPHRSIRAEMTAEGHWWSLPMMPVKRRMSY